MRRTLIHFSRRSKKCAISPPERVGATRVQAIIVAIDQYAEAATGNREFFLNKPHGGARSGDVP